MEPLKTLYYSSSPNPHNARADLGRLMCPDEVGHSVSARPARERSALAGKWMLCGDVAAGTFDLLSEAKPEDVPVRISGFTSPLGANYCVLTHEIQGHQHRFILPLWEPTVGTCIRALGETSYGYMFGRDGGNDALVLPDTIDGRSFLPLRPFLVPPSRERAPAYLRDFPFAVMTLARWDAIPPIATTREPTMVSVSIVLPGTVIDWKHEGQEQQPG